MITVIALVLCLIAGFIGGVIFEKHIAEPIENAILSVCCISCLKAIGEKLKTMDT